MSLVKQMMRGAVRLYRCEQGAEGLEKLLIVAAVVLPLLAVLMFFRDKISSMVGGAWSDVESDVESFDPSSATGVN